MRGIELCIKILYEQMYLTDEEMERLAVDFHCEELVHSMIDNDL